MKRISLLIVMMLVLSTLTNVSATEDEVVLETAEGAEEVSEKTVTESEPLLLSLEEAVRIATENSREMWKIDDGIAQMKEARKDAKSAKDEVERILDMSFQDIEAFEKMYEIKIDVTSNYVEKLLSKNDYYITFADTQQTQLEKNREMLLAGIEIETSSLYYNVLLAEQSIVINKVNLNK
ncbi:MAG: hypothetical protein PHU60_06325, partial [Tissierellia bacterium]|nr:hypothetical protein [Tissierellia bacterium]